MVVAPELVPKNRFNYKMSRKEEENSGSIEPKELLDGLDVPLIIKDEVCKE